MSPAPPTRLQLLGLPQDTAWLPSVCRSQPEGMTTFPSTNQAGHIIRASEGCPASAPRCLGPLSYASELPVLLGKFKGRICANVVVPMDTSEPHNQD